MSTLLVTAWLVAQTGLSGWGWPVVDYHHWKAEKILSEQAQETALKNPENLQAYLDTFK